MGCGCGSGNGSCGCENGSGTLVKETVTELLPITAGSYFVDRGEYSGRVLTASGGVVRPDRSICGFRSTRYALPFEPSDTQVAGDGDSERGGGRTNWIPVPAGVRVTQAVGVAIINASYSSGIVAPEVIWHRIPESIEAGSEVVFEQSVSEGKVVSSDSVAPT
jgi:hypothetical protein